MKTKQQHDFDEEIERLLSLIQMNVAPKKENQKESQVRLIENKLKDFRLWSVRELLDVAVEARSKGLDIPKSLSYFMVNYIDGKLNGTLEEDIIEQARMHEVENDSIRQSIGYEMMVDSITQGFEKGEKAPKKSMGPTVDSELSLFLDDRLTTALSPERYGYLIAQTKTTLTMVDIQSYFQHSQHKSKEVIGRLFTEYKLKDGFNRWKEKRKQNTKEDI